MPTSDIWIEKLSFGHHRLHLIEKDPECVATMLKNGFSAVGDGIDEYVKDDYDDDQTLNYVITMADCYNQLMSNQGFITAWIHLGSTRKHSAKAMKEVRDSFSEDEGLLSALNVQDLDEFLYTYAENYSKSLVDEAGVHLGKGLDDFAQWLRSGSVIIRKDSNNTANHFVIDRKRIGGDLCYKVYLGFELSKENKEVFEEWRDRFENDECWAEVNKSLWLNDESDDTKYYYYYYYYYYFSSNKAADDLFEILNEKSPHYSTQTKRLIQKVLTTLSQEDVIFARELQCRYDEYRSIAGGRDIAFYHQVFVNETFIFPEADVKKHLSEDIVDSDWTSFIDIVNPYYSDPEALIKLFKYLVENNYIKPNDLDTAIYRFTGKRKPMALVERISWGGQDKDLFYIFKKFYGGKYEKIETFFNVVIDEKIKNNGQYSAYADRSKLIQQFAIIYTAKLA